MDTIKTQWVPFPRLGFGTFRCRVAIQPVVESAIALGFRLSTRRDVRERSRRRRGYAASGIRARTNSSSPLT